MENHTRSFLKSVSFRLLATFTTVVLIFAFTKNIVISLQVGFLEFSGKLVLYYFHERIWNMVQFGRKRAHTQDMKDVVQER